MSNERHVGQEGEREYELPNRDMLEDGHYLFNIGVRMKRNWTRNRFNTKRPILLARPIREKEQS